MVYVTHNLGVVAAVCDRVGVMYAGELVEDAPVHELFSHPRHPYTRGLIDPRFRPIAEPHRSRDFVLRGLLKRSELPKGCRFAPRCDFAEEACFEQRQVLPPVAEAHVAACRRVEEVERLHRRSRLGCRATSHSLRRPTSRCSTSPISRSRTTGARAALGRPRPQLAGSSRTSRSTSAPARRSRSSANRGAASRPSRVPSAACCARSRAS